MTAKKQSITLLGSTGSIGINTLQVVREHPDLFDIVGLAAGSNVEILEAQIREFSPKAIFMKDKQAADKIGKVFGCGIEIFTDMDSLRSFCACVNGDILVAATSGTSALVPVIDAVKAGKKVALANKEILVIAGELIMAALKSNPKAALIPVDSEHSAIFQCIQGSTISDIHKLILTGSGGPLREVDAERFATISKESVINHPKWKMGKKISVDSATLMNKGLETIEAVSLFGVSTDRIEVLIHPEAVIHSMVEFNDGSVLAQLGVTDMKLPIQYALTYPERKSVPASRRLDFLEVGKLHFFAPDRKKFPCLDLAFAAAKTSGSAPCVLSASDEIAVNAYLDDKISFIQIPTVIEKVLSSHRWVSTPTLQDIQSIHEWAVEETTRLCQAF